MHSPALARQSTRRSAPEPRCTRCAGVAIGGEEDAAALELASLDLSIAPHSLLDTLTSLRDWVETDPTPAVRMIESSLRRFAGSPGSPHLRSAICR